MSAMRMPAHRLSSSASMRMADGKASSRHENACIARRAADLSAAELLRPYGGKSSSSPRLRWPSPAASLAAATALRLLFGHTNMILMWLRLSCPTRRANPPRSRPYWRLPYQAESNPLHIAQPLLNNQHGNRRQVVDVCLFARRRV